MKNIAKLLIPLVALMVTSALPLPYMFMGPLMNGVEKGLRIEVDPRYSGGEVLAKFQDPMDDDRGEGALVYPDLPSFQGKKVLDIVRYTVHRPVLNTAAGDSPDFWQLDVAFAESANPLNAPLGFSLPVIHIYIDVDGKESGSTQTALPDAELVAFDSRHPWDYAIHIDGFSGDKKGRIVSADQSYKRPVEVFFLEKSRTIAIRVGLDDPGIKRILDGRPTYHYVIVGAFDPFSPGGFMPVSENAGRRNGGGARSALSPRVYDWMAPEGESQERMLSSYDKATGAYATLVPLEAKESRGKADASKEEDKKKAAELLKVYKEKLAREKAEAPPLDLAAAANRLAEQGTEGMPLVKAYYRAGMYEKAEAASRRILESSPEHAGAATYLAMSIAGQSGQQKSPMKSMEFVSRAIAQFDQAFPLCKTPDERLTFFLQRGRYFAAVPESIFHKSAEAADDFLKASAIVKQQGAVSGRPNLLADCFIKAAKAYAQSGNPDEAEVYFHRAADFPNLTTEQIVALLERGIIPAVAKNASAPGRMPDTTPAESQDQPPQAVEKLVDVGGYNLNFRIIPGQGPAVLLESGGGLDSTEWNALAPRLARETGATVIAYDRAGFGKSDLPETKYDLREDSAALWRGLRSLGLDRNLILVGHSYGGFLIRFEATEHPDSVRGLVFVDPFTVEFVDMFGIEYCNNHPMMGKLPFDTSRPETLTKLQRAMVRMNGAQGSNLAEKIAVARKGAVPKGIPARVITAGIGFLPKLEEQKAWREAHERLTASIKGAKLVVAEKSVHMIPYSQPDLIISAVSEVIRLAR